jgi:hypothetical protein
MRLARLAKIPPLGLTAESAPFDKGVNPRLPRHSTSDPVISSNHTPERLNP